MAEIKVTAEALSQTITDYEGKKAQFVQAYQQISSEISTMMGNFKGDAAAKYWEKFGDIYEKLSQTEARMDGAIDKLKKVLEVFQNREAEHSSMVSGMETEFSAGDIF